MLRYKKLILPCEESRYLLHSKKPHSLMINLDKKPEAIKYSREASELNKLVIKLKKEVLKGTITTISLDEIDEATIPALNILRSQKHLNN